MDVKTFSEIVNSIDLYELSNKRCSKLVEADNLYKKSGINYIYELLREKLDKVVPDTEIFVEYSIISSTLEPGVNGLSCFSCISGNKTLKTNIENWMSKIVSEIYKRDGYSIYHHADFFLAPERGKSITSSINVSFSDEFKYSHKPSVGSYIKPIEFIETSISNLYVQNQSFERTYANMVANSHDIINNIGICIKEAHEELHFHYHDLFLDKTEKEEFITCYISIPIFGSRSSNILKQNVIRANANQGQGACFIFVKIPNSGIIDKKKIENIVTEELFVEINELVRIFSINYIFNLGLQLQDHVCKEAIKSAVSAIMARNMSHNLGSHIITNTKNEIKKIAGELTNDIKNAANFRGLSELLQYLQERQDFIAVIANGDKYSYAPLNLKSGIFDILAADGLSKRHAGSEPITNYILNNIVKSEDVFRKLSEVDVNSSANKSGELAINPDAIAAYNLMVNTSNDENANKVPIELQLIDKRKGKNAIFKSLAAGQESAPFSDIELSVPYGVNGRHAFLSIIENIIRNSAKHNDLLSIKNGNEKFEFTISIIIEDSDVDKGYKITLCDNLGCLGKVLSIFEEKGVIMHNGDISTLDIIDTINGTGIDKSNKGIKEILICLMWLSGSTDFWDIETNPKELKKLLKLVGVRQSDDKTSIINITNWNDNIDAFKDYSLGYQFSVRRYIEVEYVDCKTLLYSDGKFNQQALYDSLEAAYLYVFYNCKDIDSSNKTVISRVLSRTYFEDENLTAVTQNDEYYLEKHFRSSINLTDEKMPMPTIYINDTANIDDDLSGAFTDVVDRTDHFPESGDYVEFTTHYEAKYIGEGKPFEDSSKFDSNRRKFVEGISGGNFTSNLIRYAITNKRYMRIVESSYINIVIVDERIYGAQHKSLDRSGSKDLNVIVKKLREFANSGSEDAKKLALSYINEELTGKGSFNIIDIVKINKLESDDEAMNYIGGKLTYKSSDNIKDKYLRNKGIYILNCKDDGSLINLQEETCGVDEFNGKHIDYISVHYSLFEKLNKSIFNGEKDITTYFNNIFGSFHGVDANTKVAIHSGRGGLIDNEEKIAFIPLSGLEWALYNCKYVLVELFTGQKYSTTNVFNEIGK